MSKTKSLHHIVFCTYKRRMTLPYDMRSVLYRYIHTTINNNKCFLHRINGVGDHIHLLIDLNPSVSLASLVKNIKQSSSVWMKGDPRFERFEGWGKGYFSVSVDANNFEACRQYIINQELHHSRCSTIDEFKELLQKHGLEWYEADWE